jgi:cell division protein FtsB
MFDFYQKRKLRTIFNSPITQVLLGMLVVWMSWNAYVRYDIAVEMKERREKAEVELAELEKRKDELAEQVRYLQSERGIEAEMRRQFDVALPGEQVVVLLDPEKKNEVTPLPLTASENEQETKKWYQFWR